MRTFPGQETTVECISLNAQIDRKTSRVEQETKEKQLSSSDNRCTCAFSNSRGEMAYYASAVASGSGSHLPSSASPASASSSSSALLLGVTRSRTGLFLSYRDTTTRSSSTSYSRKGKGRAYDDPYAEESEGLLSNGASGPNGSAAGAAGRSGHESIEMNRLPPQWYARLGA